MRPLAVAPGLMTVGRRRFGGIALQPGAEIVVVKLPGPEHPRKSLPLHIAGILRDPFRGTLGVELVGLGNALTEGGLEAVSEHCSIGSLIR